MVAALFRVIHFMKNKCIFLSFCFHKIRSNVLHVIMNCSCWENIENDNLVGVFQEVSVLRRSKAVEYWEL